MPRFQPSPYSHRSALISMPTAAQMARLNPPTIRKGSTGSNVEKLQEALIDAGPQYTPCTATKRGPRTEYKCTWTIGKFGEDTEDSVKAFQSAKGLGVDGIVGPNTWGALGVTSAPVAAVQSVLSSIIPTAAASTGLPAPAGGEEEKFYQKSWFLPVAISASVLLIGTIIILVKD